MRYSIDYMSPYYGNRILDKLFELKWSVWRCVQLIKNKLAIRSKMKKMIALKKYRKSEKNAILLDTPVHGNLGDHAIVMAEEQQLKKYGIDFLEVTAERVNYWEDKYAKFTSKDKTIFIHGGGFLGMLWPNEEERFRRIVKAFHKQKIVVFPQTVTFDTETEEGREYLRQSQEIYSEHPDLTIFVREKKSYEFMQEYFPKVKSFLVPDIVTLLQTNLKKEKREGIYLCMRSDLEKSLSQSDVKIIESLLHTKYPKESIQYTDTVIPQQIFPEGRKTEVQKKLIQFSKAKLVITDRLHGMIFATISGTPCIALSNTNGKVPAVYEWIKDNEYIIFAEDIQKVEEAIASIDLGKAYEYNYDEIKKDFMPLSQEMERIKKNGK